MPTYKDALITLAIVFSFIALSFATADETITMTGGIGGRTFSVTTNAVRVVFSPHARLCSVVNSGSATVYAGARVTSTEFATQTAGTNALPVLASSSFEIVGGDPITSVVLQSASGTNSVTVGVQK